MKELDTRQKKQLMITSVLLAVFLFVFGTVLGYSVDSLRENRILDNIRQSEIDTESYILEQQFLEDFGIVSCDLLEGRIENLRQINYETGQQLNKWVEGKKFSLKQEDLDYAKRRYFVQEGRLFLLIESLRQNCDASYNTVLFFYKINDDASVRQGFILDKISLERNDTIVFSFDKDFVQEPFVELLIDNYQIDNAPSVVINGEKKLEGFISSEELANYLNS
jgi:hypothetical protein